MKATTYTFACLMLIMLSSCKKDYFDAKPNTGIITPQTIADYNKLLDYIAVSPKTSALPQMSSDDYYYLTSSAWQATSSKTERNAYIWASNLFDGEVLRQDWNTPYQGIFYANNALDGLANIPINANNQTEWNNLKARALFLRAYEYFDLVENFAAAYDSTSSKADLGVPLKLESGIDVIKQRATVEQTYNQILTDLATSSPLLPLSLPSARNQPSKISLMALTARIYLSMRKYSLAEKYADSCLSIYNVLVDYNTVSTTSSTPFPYTNPELLFHSTMVSYPAAQYDNGTRMSIDTVLYRSYDINDLRPKIYFVDRGASGIYPKRGYIGSGFQPFSGLAMDEVYLIKAECAARRNDLTNSMGALNTLLAKRYVTGTYVNYNPSNSQDALNKILLERRKELVWRGRRWSDLKRLNKEGANITLSRKLDGTTYMLAPNSPLYVFPIPDDEISFSGIAQNQR